MDVSSQKTLTPEQESALRDDLKRCTPETVEAAIAYRSSGDTRHLPVIILGILDRFVDPEVRPRLKGASDDLRLSEDLGIDSLTMVEIVMMVETTLGMTIDNNELRDLRSIGDIRTFIECKAKGVPLPEKPRHVSVEQILATMPHQQPFLFIQDGSVRSDEARGTYRIAGDEFFLQGHFKDNPVFPASIMLEALGQLGVLFLLTAKRPELTGAVDATKIYFTSCDGVRCQRVCRPQDVLTLTVKPKRIKHPLAVFEGHITCGSEKVAFAEEIALTFDFKAEGVTDAASTAQPASAQA